MTEHDITPDVTIVQSIRAEAKMNLLEAGAELVDNSLDAGATTIRIDIGNKEIRVSDNGRGCADLQRMLKLGTHNPHGRKIGRYGVGFNTAAICLGKSVEVESVCHAKRRRVELCWDEIQPGWKVFGPDPEDTSEATGLNIRIWDLIPRRQNISDLIAKLGARYPFLELSGKTILVNGTKTPGTGTPQLDRQLTAHGEWEGRAYQLTAGVVHQLTRPWKFGFTVMLCDRILADGLSDGCGEYSRQGFFALVELLEGVELEDRTISVPWPVDKTKSGITDTIRLFLESLLPDVEPLLKAAETESSNLVLRGLEQALSGKWLEQALFGAPALEKRPGEGGSSGTSDPKDSGRQRRHSTHVDPDSAGSVRIARGIGRAIRVKFAALEDDGDIAAVSHNSARTECILNENHPFVRAHRDIGLLETKMLVAQLVVTHWLDDGSNVRPEMIKQLRLPYDAPRFNEVQRAMARVLCHLANEETKGRSE
jgi:hypothetical protein